MHICFLKENEAIKVEEPAHAVACLQEGKIGLRRRIQAELVNGKGQFVCGAKSCQESRALSSFEVNFAYEEAGQSKQALVKLRVCPKHAEQVRCCPT